MKRNFIMVHLSTGNHKFWSCVYYFFYYLFAIRGEGYYVTTKTDHRGCNYDLEVDTCYKSTWQCTNGLLVYDIYGYYFFYCAENPNFENNIVAIDKYGPPPQSPPHPPILPEKIFVCAHLSMNTEMKQKAAKNTIKS